MLLTDGGATRGTIQNARLARAFCRQAARHRARQSSPRTFVFAVGDDANLPLLRMLARGAPTEAAADESGGPGGVLEWVRSTEPIDFKLSAFLSKIGRRPLSGLRLETSPADKLRPGLSAGRELVFRLDRVVGGPLSAADGRSRLRGHGLARRRAACVSSKGRALPEQDLTHDAPAAHLGARPRRRAARKNRARRRGPGNHRRDHPAGEEVQVRHALHVVSGGAALAAAAARDPAGRPGPARAHRRVDRLGHGAVSLRADQEAEVSRVGRHLADALPGSQGHARRPAQRAAGAARPPGAGLSRIEEFSGFRASRRTSR